MKHFFTSIVLIFILLPSFADNREVEIKEDPECESRSVIQKPTVFVDDELNTLSVKFPEQNKQYVIIVVDELGNTVCEFFTISDNTSQQFLLPISNSGTFTINIESESHSFSGKFDL